jgi:ABC-type nitrate/sulfonate/bicarbonate transport system substrate-binding protein
MLPLWAARDGGYFKKYGLDFDLISMPSGNEGMSALIGGELEFWRSPEARPPRRRSAAPMSLLSARP